MLFLRFLLYVKPCWRTWIGHRIWYVLARAIPGEAAHSIYPLMNRWVDIIDYHCSLLADKARTQSYRRAIFETVKAGDIVLDLGTGTGILAFFACQAGAQRVYAVEQCEIVEVAKEVCCKNGFADRVIFFREPSYRVALPEKVDVLLTETVGNFGLEEGILGLIIDARKRFLKEHGAIIPRSIQLFIAPVECSEAYQKIDTCNSDLYGVDFSPMRSYAVNNFYPVVLEPRFLLGDPAALLPMTFSDLETTDVRNEVSLTAKRRGVLHGIGGWFALELARDLFLSDAPPLATPNWAHAFFPLEQPVSLEQGDRLRVTICSADNGGLWRWQVQVGDKPGGKLPERTARFDHSTFLGFPLSHDKLRKAASSYAPKLSRRGEAEFFLLSLFDGEKTIRGLEKEILDRYPDCFSSLQESSMFVRKVVASYT